MIYKINKDAFKEMAESNSSILCIKNNSQLLWILLLKLSELIFCNLEPPPKIHAFIDAKLARWSNIRNDFSFIRRHGRIFNRLLRTARNNSQTMG